MDLKKIDARNHYIVVLFKTFETDLILDNETQSQMNNEAIVIGVGPDAVHKDGSKVADLGDIIALRNSRGALKVAPQSGPYKDKEVAFLVCSDVLCILEKGKHNVE